MLFEPIGEKSRRDLALEVLQAHEVGDLISYETFGETLNVEERKTIQQSVRAAAKDFLMFNKHAIESVPNEGYRIVDANDHVRLTSKQRKRSVRALKQGEALVTHVDYSKMSPEVRMLAEATVHVIGLQIDFNRRTDSRISSVERAQSAVAEKQDRTAGQVEELRERLARLEGEK